MSKSKKRLAVFVGAGASRACGYPVTADILPAILERIESGAFGDEHVDARLADLRRVLRRIVPRARVGQMSSITDVLSVIDHCLESGEELFARTPSSLSLREVRWLLERAMSRVIGKLHKREMVPREIADWIRRQERYGKRVTVISTNYDFSLDRVLFGQLGDWNTEYLKTDFGFTWRDPDDGELVHPSRNPKLSLYKLHGSLNWLGCSRCGNIYVNFFRTLVTLADGHGKWSQCECGYKPLRAVLVAPSFVRTYRDRNLLSVWRSASEALRLSDEWVFMGYSLPLEDVGIRALLMRSLYSRRNPPSVSVISRSGEAFYRYRQMFPRCQYTRDGLKAFLAGKSEWFAPKPHRLLRHGENDASEMG